MLAGYIKTQKKKKLLKKKKKKKAQTVFKIIEACFRFILNLFPFLVEELPQSFSRNLFNPVTTK